VPHREPRNEWIPLRAGPGGERELYERIEAYSSDFYQKYEAERDKEFAAHVCAEHRRPTNPKTK